MVTRTALFLIALAVLNGCAGSDHPTPSAIYRHPVSGDVQWCQKPDAVASALGGAIVAGPAAADYAGCKTALEQKGYARQDGSARLSPEDQQRYEAELETAKKALADSIRKN